MERRQTVLETELKLCKYSRHTDAWPVFTFGCRNNPTRSSLLFFFQGILTTTRTHKGTLSRPYLWLELWVDSYPISAFNLCSSAFYLPPIAFAQNYDTTESKLRREFEVYGPIKRVSVLQQCGINDMYTDIFLLWATIIVPECVCVCALTAVTFVFRSTSCTTRGLESRVATLSSSMNTSETCTVSTLSSIFWLDVQVSCLPFSLVIVVCAHSDKPV